MSLLAEAQLAWSLLQVRSERSCREYAESPSTRHAPSELHDLVYQDLVKQYPKHIMDDVSIKLVEGKEILGADNMCC